MKPTWKTYLPTIVPVVLTVAGVVAQAGQSYLTTHPHFTLGGLFGALGLAVVNHWIKSPVQ
jgi:hypothetical protein